MKISLSLLIKMAHNLHIGQKIEDFAAFESAIMRYVISQQRLRVHFRTASMTMTHYDNTSVQYIATEFNGCFKNDNFQSYFSYIYFFLLFFVFCFKHRLRVHIRTALINDHLNTLR